MSLHILKGDICKSDCDIIVNAANGIGFMGGMIGWFIKFSGVSENINYETKGKVEREARKKCLKHYLIGYMPGSIYCTSGYNLKCKCIIHAVTMWFPGTFSTMAIIKKLLPKIIAEAKKRNLNSIAMPLLGTGVGHLSKSKVMELYKSAFSDETEIDVFVYSL